MICAIEASDIPAMTAIHRQCFKRFWTTTEIEGILKNPVSFGFYARAAEGSPQHAPQNIPQGFVLAWTPGPEAEILTIAVVPEARGQGVGAALAEAALEFAAARGAETMMLEVAESNAAARALYARIGYAEIGRRPAYYQSRDGAEDALVLSRGVRDRQLSAP